MDKLAFIDSMHGSKLTAPMASQHVFNTEKVDSIHAVLCFPPEVPFPPKPDPLPLPPPQDNQRPLMDQQTAYNKLLNDFTFRRVTALTPSAYATVVELAMKLIDESGVEKVKMSTLRATIQELVSDFYAAVKRHVSNKLWRVLETADDKMEILSGIIDMARDPADVGTPVVQRFIVRTLREKEMENDDQTPPE
jgi:hypothetical protein